MDPQRRHRGLRLLHDACPDAPLMCRDLEAECHAYSRSESEYTSRILHAAFHAPRNAALGPQIVHAPDAVLTKGMLIDRIRREAQARRERFNAMLQEKYEALNDRRFQAIVRCHRCGNEEVTWEEKQTRAADEAATIFCSCPICNQRWVVR